jgi:hypothetical protein
MESTNKLPDFCFCLHNIDNTVILVKRGEIGYFPYNDGMHKGQAMVDELNAGLEVTKAQAEAMGMGSMFGWDIPAANPESYDENGKPKKK